MRLISMYCETAVFDIENLSPIIEENYHKFKEAKKTDRLLPGGRRENGRLRGVSEEARRAGLHGSL